MEKVRRQSWSEEKHFSSLIKTLLSYFSLLFSLHFVTFSVISSLFFLSLPFSFPFLSSFLFPFALDTLLPFPIFPTCFTSLSVWAFPPFLSLLPASFLAFLFGPSTGEGNRVEKWEGGKGNQLYTPLKRHSSPLMIAF